MEEECDEQKKTLLVAIGNQDRQDDGAAWHLLFRLVEHLGGSVDPEIAGVQEIDDTLSVLFTHQLSPELAPGLCGFSRVCFIDAHTGALEGNLRLEPIKPVLTVSPLTHHFTPASCLAVCRMLKEKVPEAVVLSIRGFSFEFERALSPDAEALMEKAQKLLEAWLHNNPVVQR